MVRIMVELQYKTMRKFRSRIPCFACVLTSDSKSFRRCLCRNAYWRTVRINTLNERPWRITERKKMVWSMDCRIKKSVL